MSKSTCSVARWIAVSAAIVTLTGCGAGSLDVAHVGKSGAISRTMLNHWMQAMAGGDFRAIIGTRGPRGLVSEPANYTKCASAVKLVAPRTFGGQLRLTGTQIQQKCHELHAAIKAQALSFLISVQWTIAEGAEHGIRISDTQISRDFAQFRKSPYPTKADLSRYLAERHWQLADILYQLKRNIIEGQLLPKFARIVKLAGGGESSYARLALQRVRTMTAKTTCSPGYVVNYCKEYRGSTSLASPNVILERMVKQTQ
jgi:hypothetical protein